MKTKQKLKAVVDVKRGSGLKIGSRVTVDGSPGGRMKTTRIKQLDIARETFERLAREAQERVREMEESLAYVRHTKTDTAGRALSPARWKAEVARWIDQVEAARIVAGKLGAL